MWVTISTFVLGLTGSLVARVMLSLGLGTVTYAALSVYVTDLNTHVFNSYNSMPVIAYQIVNLGGFGTALKIITGALVTKASLMAIKQIRPL